MSASRPAWRSLIGPVADEQTVRLALGVELRVRHPAPGNPWAAREVRAVTAREIARGADDLVLGIRPLMQSPASRAWVQGDATWETVRRSPQRFGRSQARWFADLLSLARDSLLMGTSAQWLTLDHIESPLLWAHLREGEHLGIVLRPTQKGTAVRRAEHGGIVAQVDRDASGDLTLTADVTIDGQRVAPDRVRTIGHSGVYAVELRGARIVLTLAEVALNNSVHALLAARGPIHVPAADEPAFLHDAYPAIARRTEIQASAAAALPALPAPSPVLVLTYLSGDRIEYRFEWDYVGFGRFPASATGDAVRDRERERLEQERLAEVWAGHSPELFRTSGAFEGIDAAEFATRVVPAFEAAGVATLVHGRRKAYAELTGDPEITVTTVESSDPDWFDLGVLVTIDGRRIPFTPLFTALSRGKRKLLLVDGSHFSLNHPALQRLRDLLDEAAELSEWETGPRISRYQLTLWEDFEDLADQAKPAVTWRAAAEGLREATPVPPVPAPAGLRAALRPYQQAGLDWLAFLWRHRLGGILADDMGLGKTLQILALIQHARETGEQRPFLVIAPTSVLPTWYAEAARFAPELAVARADDGAAVRTAVESDAASDLVVTSYTLLRIHEETFARAAWAGVILDEAQFVKNAKTRVHRAVAALRADAVYAVTGTPLENRLSELWALLALTAPGLFPSAPRFQSEYIKPIEEGKVPENEEGGEYRRRRLERLRRRIRPLVLRRKKEHVAADLPPKQEQVLPVEPGPAHRARYDAVLQRERQKVLGLLDDLDRNRFIVFRSLTLLRMLSLAPGLVDPADAAAGSAKIDVLTGHLEQLRAEGHRALVFSQFTSYLSMVAERLDEAGISHAYLDGSTRRRDDVIDAFRAGEQTAFLISLKAGGFGLTLTEADYVFLLDPWWNPAAEAQAIDRTHRIGQHRPVTVYRLIATGTIEEKVRALQERKARLFSAVMDDDELFAKALTADDIRGLFGA